MPIAAVIVYWFGTDHLLEIVTRTGSVRSVDSRLELWNRAVYVIQDFSFTGVGTGTLTKVIPLLYPMSLYPPQETPQHTHNLYLQIAVTLGIPGLVATLGLISASLFLGKTAFVSFLSRENTWGAAVTLGYLAGLVAFLANGFLDSPFWLNKPHAVPFFFMGMLIVLHGAAVGATIERQRTRTKWWRTLFVFVSWVLISLTLIAFLDEYPYWALGMAIPGGVYLGYEASRC